MQAELDAVVGSARLPVFADKDALPYCNAVGCWTTTCWADHTAIQSIQILDWLQRAGVD
jgi:hypothetical protein